MVVGACVLVAVCAGLYVREALQPNPPRAHPPLETLLVFGFFLAFAGGLAFFLAIGRRLLRMGAGGAPLWEFRMEVGPTGWRSTWFEFGKTGSAECDARQVTRILVDGKRRVVAELAGRLVVLTVPLLDFEGAWLQQALTEFYRIGGASGLPVHPYVPSGDLSQSPGARLRYRIPIDRRGEIGLRGCLVAALVLNGAAGALFLAFRSSGPAVHWGFLAVLVPFGLLGIVSLLLAFLKLLSVLSGEPQTTVELSDHPLYPGGRYRVFLSESNSRAARSQGAWLVCEERVTYAHGTDSRTETKRVYEQEIPLGKEPKPERTGSWQASGEFEVPHGAMHSFDTGRNKVVWKIIVGERGKLRVWNERVFPVVVYPGDAGSGT